VPAATIISAIIVLTMEAASTSETFVNFYQTTRRYNPEDSHLHIRRRENLRSHNFHNILVSTEYPVTFLKINQHHILMLAISTNEEKRFHLLLPKIVNQYGQCSVSTTEEH
jgi:hypothetical protein